MFANKLRFGTRLVQLFLLGACALPLASIAGTDLDAGISLYKNGDYHAALSFLQAAVRGADKGNPDAHYMLANTLLNCEQTESALAEYRECYKLAPTGRNAQHCLTALKTYAIQSSNKSIAPAPTAPRVAAPAPVRPGVAGQGPETKQALEKTWLLINFLRSRLPVVPRFQPESPPASSISTWDLIAKANFYHSATQRLTQANEHLEDAEKAYKNVIQIVQGACPRNREFGEDQSGVKARQRMFTEMVANEKLLAPYEQVVAACKKEVEAENQLVQQCADAVHTLSD